MPRIQTTRTVKIALIVLRLYLVAMLLVILFAFYKRYTKKDEVPTTGYEFKLKPAELQSFRSIVRVSLAFCRFPQVQSPPYVLPQDYLPLS